MDLLSLLQILKTIPRLGELIALAKSMPTIMDDLSQLLALVEKALDDAAKLAPGFDPTASKAAIEKVRALLATVESTLKSIVGG